MAMALCPHQLQHNKLGQGTLVLRVAVVVLASRCGRLTEAGAQESKESGRLRSPRDSTVTVSTRPGNEYFSPGCLAEPDLRFHKYFRISRQRFDEIYKAAALIGLVGLHPEEPMYSEVHPEGPGRPGHHQDDKKIPLCLMIGAAMRRVASGNKFASLGEEFHIGGSTLHSFDGKFWHWFRKEYWSTWVGGVSGVGFDDLACIQREEKLFRQMGLPGFITCMDGVHFAWERAPYQIRWQYIGKEGYPTIVVNLHCTATGWIKYATTVFAGATNDKTIVRIADSTNRVA